MISGHFGRVVSSTAMTALALMVAAGAAQAKVPCINAPCPGGIEVHADEGGPVYINGNEAALHKINDRSYDAKGGGVTVSLGINPDGSVDVMYTGKGGANGICAVADDTITEDGGCPSDVSEADRYKFPACN